MMLKFCSWGDGGTKTFHKFWKFWKRFLESLKGTQGLRPSLVNSGRIVDFCAIYGIIGG